MGSRDLQRLLQGPRVLRELKLRDTISMEQKKTKKIVILKQEVTLNLQPYIEPVY